MYQAVIIDDEPLIVEGLTKAIDWTGFQIEIGFAGTDSVAALEYILTNPVSIVITDVSMPVMNGLVLIQKIKEAKPSIYVIVLSAYDNFEYTKTALRCGAENYLLKPLDPDELSDSISQIINHIMEREQLNSTYGRSMMTFRNAFTEQWLKNTLTSNALVTKAELLGINFNVPSFTVAVFSCPEGGEVIMSRFFDFLLNYLLGHYTGNFFFETPLRLVGVLSPATEDESNIRSFLTTVTKAALSNSIPVFTGVGTTVEHYLDVPKSYNQADSLSFLEYSGLSCAFYEDMALPASSGFIEAANKALNAYTSDSAGNYPLLKELFDKYEPAGCACYILSKRITLLCKKEYELHTKFPELAELLKEISETENMDYLSVTRRFLEKSETSLTKVSQPMYPIVNAVIKILEEFSDKDISLKTLAARLNVTPSYLGTVFHQQTGFYFNDYLTDARLKYAAHLLETTDLKIKDIVEKTGFSSQTYFNRSFKDILTLLPPITEEIKKYDAL